MQISGEIPLHGCFLVSPCNEYTKKEVMDRTVFCLDILQTKYHFGCQFSHMTKLIIYVALSTGCKHNNCYAVYNYYM